MRLRNDSGTTLHIPTDPPLTVGDGETVDYPVYVAGLTPVDAEFVDGEWQPIATKTVKPKSKNDQDQEA